MTWNWGMLPYVVVLLLMAWRVWRLESSLEAFDRALMRKGDVDWLQGALNENLCRCVAGSEQRVSALARALGYEWKRTDAKEGWEKRVPIVGRTMAWSWADEAPKYPFPVSDRRKADRRKPAHQAAPKSPPKKSRRVH